MATVNYITLNLSGNQMVHLKEITSHHLTINKLTCAK